MGCKEEKGRKGGQGKKGGYKERKGKEGKRTVGRTVGGLDERPEEGR
jgi:hypothetical protein